jgi:hypothetical protein
MARVAQSLPPDASRPPVLSSPELAMLQAREALDALDSPRSTKPQPAKPQGAAG